MQSQDESDDERLLRVVLPDGSTSVMQAKPSDSLRSLLATLLSKKSDLSITSIEVFPLDSDRVSVPQFQCRSGFKYLYDHGPCFKRIFRKQ